MIKYLSLFLMIIALISACSNKQNVYKEDFNKYQNRVWINQHMWPIPLEEWKIKDGRVECIGEIANMRLNLLTHVINGEGNFELSVDMGITNEFEKNSNAGIRLGIQDDTDSDIRSLCYFGKGIDAGINTEGYLFINEDKSTLPIEFDLTAFNIHISGTSQPEKSTLKIVCKDYNGQEASMEKNVDNLSGMISLVQNFANQGYFRNHPKFYFDNISLQGNNVVEKKENSFGPVLFSMYTLDDNELNLTAQLPPLNMEQEHQAKLEIKNGNTWETAQSVNVHKDSWTAPFKVKEWNSDADKSYRVTYTEKYKDGSEEAFYYTGTIRKEPEGKELKMAGMTCQYHYGFPYKPLVNNLSETNPDILYFSGDQIYEGNGGYGIIRFPADRAILNYLGKWYMFGWAFGDLMKDRPTICIADDHEVYQGNLWGDGGEKVSEETWKGNKDCISGFVQPVEMVNVVMKTNSSHLPDPYDPRPMKNDIKVYYTSINYGGVSFAVVGDRIFKSGPEEVATWEGRKDHLKEPLDDPSILEKPGLTMLGSRQMKFLNDWVSNWDGEQIKVLLSQTIFANASTHHGPNRMYLEGDLDSGGWPKSSRDSVIRLINKCKAFHICGDQHLTSMIQYGTEKFRDAGWTFCTPAIAVGYPRFFLPDQLYWKIQNRPQHNHPNTGEYKDGFGNKNYIYAVGNPDDKDQHENRYKKADLKASGFGLIHFNKEEREITCESFRFLGDLDKRQDAQFPGWPVSIDLDENTVIK
jgi:phosphodiesterase/alkaline phosphatase D-like protein